MHVILPKDEAQFDASWRFIKKTDITDVRLIGSSSKCMRGIDSVSGPLLFDFAFHPNGSRVERKTVLITTTFHFKGYEKSNRGETVLAVNCKFEAGYTGTTVPTPEEIDAYARANAIFNCWPFFREFLHSTVARMGFPPPTLPFLELVTVSNLELAQKKSRKASGRPRSSKQKQATAKKARSGD